AEADEDDANRTMVVVRPQGGLRIPPPGAPRQHGQDDAARAPSGNGAEAADRHSTTVPGRLPGRGPATPPAPGPVAGNRPAPVMPGQPAGPHPPHPARPPHPAPFPPGPFPPGDGASGRPPSLGTDLFTMRGPDGPDTGTRVRVLVTMGIVLVVVLVLILLGVFFFFSR
ncbi:hypothetical protein AB0J39_20630, partial [Microbispora sp. NPDC049633]